MNGGKNKGTSQKRPVNMKASQRLQFDEPASNKRPLGKKNEPSNMAKSPKRKIKDLAEKDTNMDIGEAASAPIFKKDLAKDKKKTKKMSKEATDKKKDDKKKFRDKFDEEEDDATSPKNSNPGVQDDEPQDEDTMFFGKEQVLELTEEALKKGQEDRERPLLPEGTIVTTERFKYVVVRLLGSGGFGDVYAMRRVHDGLLLAMKTEVIVQETMMQRLKREVLFYEIVNATRSSIKTVSQTRHILFMPDRGHNQFFKYLFMPYTGVSLESIYCKLYQNNWHPHTTLKVSLQTFYAIRNMHNFGYIHRDLKPDNFVVGKEHWRQTIFVMDFGMAACCDTPTDAVNSEYDFIGTEKYASRTVHRALIAHRKDDMESWLYMVLELFGPRLLPWHQTESKEDMLELKEAFFDKKYDEALLLMIPSQVLQIRDSIGELKNEALPNYDKIETLLMQAIEENKVDLYAPWEWTSRIAADMDLKDQKDRDDTPIPSDDNKTKGKGTKRGQH